MHFRDQVLCLPLLPPDVTTPSSQFVTIIHVTSFYFILFIYVLAVLRSS